MINKVGGKGQEKSITARSTWNFSLWWAKTGSNWFRNEHHLKEQSDAQMIVSADAGGYMTVEKKEKGNKKSHGAEHVELSIMVGDNRIELLTFCL